MRSAKPIRCLVVPVALLALLLVAMTLGSVWHHHDGSSDATCQICHLSHQPIERPLANDRAPVLALLGTAQEPQDTGLAPTPIVPRVPARAPPIA
jgi:hypothetical protein